MCIRGLPGQVSRGEVLVTLNAPALGEGQHEGSWRIANGAGRGSNHGYRGYRIILKHARSGGDIHGGGGLEDSLLTAVRCITRSGGSGLSRR